MPVKLAFLMLVGGLFMSSCGGNTENIQTMEDQTLKKGQYGFDSKFLSQYGKGMIELSSEDGKSRLLLASGYQGRVLTSTADGDSGLSFGWINYDLIQSGKFKQQFNPIGGEERFWLGPEGGQYSLYFKKGDSFDINHWQVPALIDTVAYKVKSKDPQKVVFTAEGSLLNYSGYARTVQIERTVRLMDATEISKKIGLDLPTGLKAVAYESQNRVTNTGQEDWKKEQGLLSVWLLGMFTPSPETIVIIPFRPGPEALQHITDNYFGSIPAERLVKMDSVIYFKCDGKYRSKIGLAPTIAREVAGSYDFKNQVLHLVFLSVDPEGLYVNSKWEIQKEPFKGDVVNSYNDGPLADGTQLGPFYEIESSSSAKELKKGETMNYSQTTCHLQGDFEALRFIAQRLLGVDLATMGDLTQKK